MPRTSLTAQRSSLAFAAAVTLVACAVAAPLATRAAERPLRIGIVGAGRIGGNLAALWVKAGHEVLVSSRHPAQLEPLCKELGARCKVGTPAEAAAFGEVVLVSVPYGALPQVGKDLAKAWAGKVVLDTGNPYPERDGEMAVQDRRRGTGAASAEYLPGVRLVRAFNAISWKSLKSEAHRAGEKVGIPIAGDDPKALELASQLVRDAGFDPVVVGPLAQARRFDYGTPVYTQLLTAKQLREKLGP